MVIRCLDNPSTHEPTTWHFNPHNSSTQRTAYCDNSPLWHSHTCTIHPGIFCPPPLRGGRFVTCDMTSTLLQMLCDIMSTLPWSKIWTVCHKIFRPICDVLPAVWRHVDVFSQDFSQHVCDVQLAFQRSVDVLSHDFLDICDVLPPAQQTVDVLSQDFFSTRLPCPAGFSAKCGHFVIHISGHLWCPATCSANCGRFVIEFFQHVCHVQPAFQRNVDICHTFFWTFVMSCHLLSKLWTFCHRIYKKIDGPVRRKKQEISWDSPFKWHLNYSMSRQSCASYIKFIHGPLRISCHTWKWAEMGKFFGKMDLLLRWHEMSQQSWTKNTRTKCHRLWDKILQWGSLSHCDIPSKFIRSECQNLGWTDNPSTSRRNVTVVKCHSRRFVGWTLSLGRNVAWLVRGWMDGSSMHWLFEVRLELEPSLLDSQLLLLGI